MEGPSVEGGTVMRKAIVMAATGVALVVAPSQALAGVSGPRST